MPVPEIIIFMAKEFREIYCINCKKVVGVYSVRFFNDDKISELLKNSHSFHVKAGHEIKIRLIQR